MYKTEDFINFIRLAGSGGLHTIDPANKLKNKYSPMKNRIKILRIAALLLVLSQLAACAKHIHTDNKRPDKHHYRRAGRAW